MARKSSPAIGFFLWLALPLYLAFALLTPPFQTPDEQQHLFRAWQLSEFQLLGERRGDEAGGVLPGGLAAAAIPEIASLDPHIKREVPPPRAGWHTRRTAPDAEPARFHNFLGSTSYSPLSYIPQIAAVGIGRASGWSVESILLTGRILNILTFLGLFGLALRHTPWGTPAFLFIALHPTTISSVATFGQDGLVIAFSALLVAAGLRAMLVRQSSRLDLAGPAFAALGIALTKFVYLPLIFTGGVFSKKLRELAPTIGIFAAAAAIAILWLGLTSEARVPPVSDVPATGERLGRFLVNPSDFLHALAGTYSTHGLEIVAGAYRFGWLNIGPVVLPMFLAIAAFQALLLAGGEGQVAPDRWQRGWLLLVAAGTLLLASFAMWLYYTPIGMDRIRGMQSRYLLPVALVAFPAILPQSRRSDRALFWMAGLLVVANVASLIAIAKAFYVI